MTLAVIDIAFVIVRCVFTLHSGDVLQLVTRIPAHNLPANQLQQIAIGIKTLSEIHIPVIVRQAAITVRCNVHVAGEVVCAFVAHLQQVTRSVVAVTLCVVADLARIERRQRLQTG
ncbi:hypothetical protein ALQ92_200264 [Pseudomonas syringae pv. pisi]|nr:hypothetical protein ALQ92_200264 [Pseudomonas syringae pv. pisi]